MWGFPPHGLLLLSLDSCDLSAREKLCYDNMRYHGWPQQKLGPLIADSYETAIC